MDVLYGRAGQLNAETTPGLPEVLPELWIARYDPSLDEQVDEPWEEGPPEEYVEPRDYDEWVYWQFSASGYGGEYGVVSRSIDRNVFNGTHEELRAKANLHEPAPEPKPPLSRDDTRVIRWPVNSPAQSLDIVEADVQMDKSTLLYAFQLVFPKGLLKEARVFARVGENKEHILFGRYSVQYRDWVYDEFPKWVDMNDSMYLTFKFFPVGGIGGTVYVDIVYEEWD